MLRNSIYHLVSKSELPERLFPGMYPHVVLQRLFPLEHLSAGLAGELRRLVRRHHMRLEPAFQTKLLPADFALEVGHVGVSSVHVVAQ